MDLETMKLQMNGKLIAVKVACDNGFRHRGLTDLWVYHYKWMRDIVVKNGIPRRILEDFDNRMADLTKNLSYCKIDYLI